MTRRASFFGLVQKVSNTHIDIMRDLIDGCVENHGVKEANGAKFQSLIVAIDWVSPSLNSHLFSPLGNL
jgi:hypothetical protein